MNNQAKWIVEFIPEAMKDLDRLDGSVKPLVFKAIDKICTNPMPQSEGGYGKPLGNKAGNDLSGLCKIKLKQSGIRIIYSLVTERTTMRLIIIGMRSENEVYKEAARRVKNI